MEKLHVIATNDRRILTVALASDVPRLLGESVIKGEWFYKQPKELHDFFKTNPDQLEYFLKGFSYWIESNVKGFTEKYNRYEKLKRLLKEFSQNLFEKIRGLATRIAKQVKKIIKKPKAVYEEQLVKKETYKTLSNYDSHNNDDDDNHNAY